MILQSWTKQQILADPAGFEAFKDIQYRAEEGELPECDFCGAARPDAEGRCYNCGNCLNCTGG